MIKFHSLSHDGVPNIQLTINITLHAFIEPLGGSFIIIITAVAAIVGMLTYRKKKLQANVVIKNDCNM